MNARLDLDPMASRRDPPLTPMERPNGQNRSRKRRLDYLQGITLVAIVCVFMIAFAGSLFL